MSGRIKDKIDKYKKSLSVMISSDDFSRFLDDVGSNKILKYSELQKYNTMDELLPEKTDYKIILTESQINSGHWCCILKYNDTIDNMEPEKHKYLEWQTIESLKKIPDSHTSDILRFYIALKGILECQSRQLVK